MPAGLQGVNKQRGAAKKTEYRAPLGPGQMCGVDGRAIGKRGFAPSEASRNVLTPLNPAVGSTLK